MLRAADNFTTKFKDTRSQRKPWVDSSNDHLSVQFNSPILFVANKSIKKKERHEYGESAFPENNMHSKKDSRMEHQGTKQLKSFSLEKIDILLMDFFSVYAQAIAVMNVTSNVGLLGVWYRFWLVSKTENQAGYIRKIVWFEGKIYKVRSIIGINHYHSPLIKDSFFSIPYTFIEEMGPCS